MDKWWLNPLLDDEYGKYDFYATPLPENYAKWEFTKHKWKCDDCRKDSHLRFVQRSYFYTLDGYDCMDYDICWKCFLKDKMRSVKWKLKRKIKKEKEALKLAGQLYKCDSSKGFKTYYKTSREIVK